MTSPSAASESAMAPVEVPTSAPMPGIHMRAFLTWLAIFPLVTIGMTILAPVTEHWPIVLRALVLTALVVPTAVYLAMPQLLRAHGAVTRRRARGR